MSIQVTPGNLGRKLAPSAQGHGLVATTEPRPPDCHQAVQKWRDVERQRGGDEEAIRRWERPLMRDRQAGEIRSGK